jgi:hypothetical protein
MACCLFEPLFRLNPRDVIGDRTYHSRPNHLPSPDSSMSVLIDHSQNKNRSITMLYVPESFTDEKYL